MLLKVTKSDMVTFASNFMRIDTKVLKYHDAVSTISLIKILRDILYFEINRISGG